MISPDDKQKFLDEIENMPIISVACKRVGIAKATIYRWFESDPEFRKKYDKASKRGRLAMVDLGESQLIKLVGQGNLGAIKHLLRYNDRRYYEPRRAIRPKPEKGHIVAMNTYVIPDNARYIDPKTGDFLEKMPDGTFKPFPMKPGVERSDVSEDLYDPNPEEGLEDESSIPEF